MDDPGMEEKRPASHSVHSDWPNVEAVPASHAWNGRKSLERDAGEAYKAFQRSHTPDSTPCTRKRTLANMNQPRTERMWMTPA